MYLINEIEVGNDSETIKSNIIGHGERRDIAESFMLTAIQDFTGDEKVHEVSSLKNEQTEKYGTYRLISEPDRLYVYETKEITVTGWIYGSKIAYDTKLIRIYEILNYIDNIPIPPPLPTMYKRTTIRTRRKSKLIDKVRDPRHDNVMESLTKSPRFISLGRANRHK